MTPPMKRHVADSGDSMKSGVDILYQDKSIVAVNKAARLATVRERSGERGLAEVLEAHVGRKIFTIHRLDKETSGLVLFALDATAHRDLSLQFQKRQIAKTYRALVEGTVDESEGLIDLPLLPASRSASKMRIDRKKGKESVTSFLVEKRFQNHSLLSLGPKTGRMHQVRIHCAAIGHPIVCDALYGSGTPLYLSEIKRDYRRRRGRKERPLIARLALHALSLEFTHPRTGERMTLEAELPEDFRIALRNLEKYSKPPAKL
jgi:23S rRNA pseudouridine955/2504/2580 synthase/23S rRNA pseudouridine1911/1915/1917 synthase